MLPRCEAYGVEATARCTYFTWKWHAAVLILLNQHTFHTVFRHRTHYILLPLPMQVQALGIVPKKLEAILSAALDGGDQACGERQCEKCGSTIAPRFPRWVKFITLACWVQKG